jgi:hypothetical protein
VTGYVSRDEMKSRPPALGHHAPHELDGQDHRWPHARQVFIRIIQMNHAEESRAVHGLIESEGIPDLGQI